MKNLIKFIKKERQKILLIIIGFLSYGYFLSTLVTTFIYYILLLIISFIVCVLMNLFKNSASHFERVTVLFKIYLMLYFSFFTMLFFVSKITKPEIHIVPLNGYSTYKTNAIYFRFQNENFSRHCNLNGYPLDSLEYKYNVKLNLKQPLPNIYFIQYFEIVRK